MSKAAKNLMPTSKYSREIDWTLVKRILVVRLRSIGDTVLSTPSLIALRRFLPNAEIDILLEDWVAPVLQAHDAVDNVISVGKGFTARSKVALGLRGRNYDVAFNLHGGTTATLFTAASRATHRIGYAGYQYSFLHNHLLSSSSDFWQAEFTHSAEQQLALLGFVGVPVDDRPKTRLVISQDATARVCLNWRNKDDDYALLHPATAFTTKQWPIASFARTSEFLAAKGLQIVAVASKNESSVLEELKKESKAAIRTFDDLSLPEVTALAARARIFVGNDSGIAHIAGGVGTPTVVIFGSSNRNHWRPWTDAPHEIVFEDFSCQPCPGYECGEFGEPRCILSVKEKDVHAAVDRLLQ